MPTPVTYAAEGGDDQPSSFPSGVDGYESTGAVVSETIRVFVDRGIATTGLGATVGGCDLAYWMRRWRSVSDILSSSDEETAQFD